MEENETIVNRTRKMPSKKQIRDFWDKILFKTEKSYPWIFLNKLNGVIDTDICMACGLPKPTQRAHIKAVQDGGGDTLRNIHLLCSDCHSQSEMLNGKIYWEWFWGIDTELKFKNYIAERVYLANKYQDRN